MRFLRMLWKCFTVWEVEPATEEELRSAHVVLAFSDSKMMDGSPGPGNELIAGVARQLHVQYGLAILAQEEVVMADPYGSFAFIARGPQHGKSTRAWNTATITDSFASVCREKGWRRAVVVTIPDHLPRALWVAERRKFRAVAARMPRGQYLHPGLALWSARGGKWRFRIRDLIVRLFFLACGDI